MKFFTEKSETPSKEKVLDIKTLLKLARQYIDENNPKKAQQCCKKVLRKNSQNYMALVLLGKSYGKTDDALLSYEKATDLKPDHALAWQGLAHYYEGKEDESVKPKLLSIYNKLLTLNIEEDYANKLLDKFGKLGSILKNNDTISSLIQYIKVQDNDKLTGTAKAQLLLLLQSKVLCKNEDLSDVIHILKTLNYNNFSEDNSELILLGNLIFQNNDFISAVEDIISLEPYPRSFSLKIWLAEQLCKTFIKQNSLHGFEIDKYMTELITGIDDSKYGSILIAILYYNNSMYEEAYQKCISVVKSNFDGIEEIDALFLLKCSKMTPNPIRTKNVCKYLSRKENLNSPTFIKTLNEVLLSCYIEEKDFYKSLDCLKNIPVEQIDTNVITELGNLFLRLDVVSDATWEILSLTDYFDLFKVFTCIKSGQFSEAIEILHSYDKHPVKYYYLALAYWFTNQDDESLENFQKAIELIPEHPKIYYCLGIHYYRRKDDMEESRKCFEKSYSLCKTDINVIKMLSIIYVRLGLYDLEFDLLQTAFNKPQTKKFWVCTRLGRIYYTRDILDEALICIQAAIDIKPQDVTAHEFMGNIYFKIKDFDYALISYIKVLELSSNSGDFLKSLNRIGCIYSEQKSYDEATFIFDNILDFDPGNVAALKSLTENRLIIAFKHVANDLFRNAREQMQRAINRITTAMSMGIKDIVYWLLYGDVLVFLTRLPNEYSFIHLQSLEGESRKDKIDMYKMAIESYSNVIKYRDSSALFKCAVTYFEYYCETKNIVFCKTSYNLAILFMKVNPNVWSVWDLLGKLSYRLNKPENAYYCFFKCLTLGEETENKIWFDLGLFYLKLNKYELNNYNRVINRFDVSTLAPTFSNELNEESSDTTLSENLDISDVDSLNEDEDNHEIPEGRRNIDSSSPQPNEPTFDSPIESLKMVPNANEIIEWYLSFEEETAWSCSSLGNLQESKGLFIPALRYYDRAYEIAHNNLKSKMLSHKGRVLMKMHEYEEAVNVYNGIPEKNLEDTCTIAYALHEMGNYKKSYDSYIKALRDLCENDDERVNVLVAMSNVAYKLNGLDDGAMLLLQAVEIKCGEGQDFTLPFLKSYVFKKVDIQLVAHVMSVYLHKHIDKATWWYYMGLNYLKGVNKYAKLTRACIKRAIRINTEFCQNGKLYALHSVAEFYAGNRQTALTYATRALKLYPMQPELWAIFILCVYEDKTWPRKAYFLRVVIDTVRKFVNVSHSLDKWLTKVEEETTGLPKNFNFTFVRNSISQ